MPRVNAYNVRMFECYGCGTEHRHDQACNRAPPFVWECSGCGARVTITAYWNTGFAYEPIKAKPASRSASSGRHVQRRRPVHQL